jgi:2'-5' RNA ligase
MKLTEINPLKGTYVGLRVLDPANMALYAHCQANNIPVKQSEFERRLHVTLIYSRKRCPKLFADPGHKFEATVKGYDIFGQGNERILVALLNAPSVSARHLMLMAKHNATYDFPVYLPHITLCHNFTGNVEDITPINFPIILGAEYMEDLDTDHE